MDTCERTEFQVRFLLSLDNISACRTLKSVMFLEIGMTGIVKLYPYWKGHNFGIEKRM